MYKKGIFLPLFAVCVLIIVIYTLYTFAIEKNPITNVMNLGELQNNLIQSYYDSEKDQFYLKSLSDYMIDKSIKDFENIPWFPEVGGSTNFNVDLKKQFIKIFKDNLNARSNLKFDEDDFEIENNFIGYNKRPLVYNKKGDNYNYTYIIKPTLQQEINMDLNKFILLKQEIKNGVSCLNDAKDNSELVKCISNPDLNLELNKVGSLVSFKIINDKEIYILEDNKIKKVKPVFKFSLDLLKPSTF